MTLFGILWILLIVFCFFKKDIKYMLFITILSMCFQCSNVFYLNGIGVGPGVLVSYLFFLKSILTNKLKICFVRSNYGIYGLLLIIIGIMFYSSSKNNILLENYLVILQFLGYIFCFFGICSIRKKISNDELYQIFRSIIVIIILLGLLQFFTNIGILPLKKVLEIFIYNDPSTDVVFHKENYSRVMSTFMEPSYYAGFIVGAFYYIIIQKNKWKENWWIILVMLLEIILTKSSTAYGAFSLMGILFMIFSKNIKKEWKILCVFLGILFIIILYLGFYDLLDSVLFSKNMTGSYRTRVKMDNKAYSDFLSSPIYGVGYKNTRGSTIIKSLLGELGILGIVSFIFLNLYLFFKLLKIKNISIKKSIYRRGVVLGLMTSFICQLIACPDIDLCTYWIWMYLIAAVGYENRRV